MLKVLLLAATLVFANMIGSAWAADKLVFGDQWQDFYKQLSAEEPLLMPDGWREIIKLPPPPDDNFTRVEVRHIIALKNIRVKYQPEIDKQISDVLYPFSDSLRLRGERLKRLHEFWQKLLPDVARVTMHFKAKFDRARPRQYSGKVSPSIEPPGHPSYPSGHSTDAYTLALLLAQIWSEKKSQLLSIAQQIAINREIGGVHYRSDTIAGYLLAQQIVSLLPHDEKARVLIARLKQELADED